MNRIFRWSPIALLLAAVFLVGCGGGGSAHLRVMNASPDESNVDVLVDNNTLASSVAYASSTGYRSVGSGSRRLRIEPSGTSNAVIDQTLNLSSKSNTTVLAVNYASNISAAVFTDDNSAPSSGNVKIRLINALPSIGLVDVYVVSPGTDLFSVDATTTNLAFAGGSGYTTLTAGSYEVYFTLPGQKTAFIDSGPFTVSSGQIRTLVGLNSQTGGYTFSILSDLN